MGASFFDLTPGEPDLEALPPARKPIRPDCSTASDRQRSSRSARWARWPSVRKAYVRSIRSLVAIGRIRGRHVAHHHVGGGTAGPASDPLSTWMRGRSLTSAFHASRRPARQVEGCRPRNRVTLNIVFIAAVADAIGIYHRQHDHPIDGFRINMPISLRAPGDGRPATTGARQLRGPMRRKGPTTRLKQLVDVVDTAHNDPALGLAEGTVQSDGTVAGTGDRTPRGHDDEGRRRRRDQR